MIAQGGPSLRICPLRKRQALFLTDVWVIELSFVNHDPSPQAEPGSNNPFKSVLRHQDLADVAHDQGQGEEPNAYAKEVLAQSMSVDRTENYGQNNDGHKEPDGVLDSATCPGGSGHSLASIGSLAPCPFTVAARARSPVHTSLASFHMLDDISRCRHPDIISRSDCVQHCFIRFDKLPDGYRYKRIDT